MVFDRGVWDRVVQDTPSSHCRKSKDHQVFGIQLSDVGVRSLMDNFGDFIFVHPWRARHTGSDSHHEQRNSNTKLLQK